MKKLFFISMLICNLSYADDPKIIAVSKGQEAPYDGVLLNKDAAVSLKVEIDTSSEKCNILTNKEKDTQIANCDYQKSILINQCEREKSDLNTRITTISKELELYKEKVKEEQSKSSSEFWKGTFIGAAGGVLVTSIVGLGIYIFR